MEENKLNTKLIALLVIIMFALAWTSMKLSLPALPSLIKVFHTTPAKIKLSVSLFFACYACSQVFWGAISEKYGRRKVILSGLFLSLFGTCLVIFSPSILFYILGRCLEGVGIGVVSPVGRAVLVDCFDRPTMARVLAIVSSTTGITPALAPIIGGFILVLIGWRFIFVFFFILLASYLIWSFFFLPETHLERPKESSLIHLSSNYFTILSRKEFWGYIVCYAFIQGSLLGYYGAMPFWYVQQWHVPEQYYAFLALFSVAGYVIALLITRYFVKKFSLETLLRFGLVISLLAGLVSLIFSLLALHGIVFLVLVMSLLAIASGIVFPSANAGVMAYFKSQAAMVSALSSTFMFLMAALFSWIESHLFVGNMWEITTLLLVVSLIVITSNYLFMPKQVNS